MTDIIILETHEATFPYETSDTKGLLIPVNILFKTKTTESNDDYLIGFYEGIPFLYCWRWSITKKKLIPLKDPVKETNIILHVLSTFEHTDKIPQYLMDNANKALRMKNPHLDLN